MDEELDLLTEVNDGCRLIKLYVKLELGCTLSAAQVSVPGSLSLSQATSDAFSVLMNNQRVAHQNKSIHEKLGLPERREEKTGKDKVHNKLIEFCIDKSISLNKRSIERRNRAWKSLLNILWKLNEVGKKRVEWQERPPIDLDLFLGNVFYPCSECIKTRIPKPQPYRGSKRKRQTMSNLEPPASQRTIGEAAEESLVGVDGLEPYTEPSGDFSEYDD